MRKGAATLIIGVTFGIIGAFIYNRIQNEAKDQDAEKLLEHLDGQLKELERLKEQSEIA